MCMFELRYNQQQIIETINNKIIQKGEMERRFLMKKKIFAVIIATTMSLSMLACGGGGSASSEKDKSASSSSEQSTAEVSSKTESANDEKSSSSVDVSELKIGIIMKSSDEFQNKVVEGAKDAAIEAGVKEENFKAVASTSESDSYQQVTAVEDMISNGTDILLVSCQEENALKDSLQKAVDAGVALVMVDTDNSLVEGKVTFIGTDNYAAAYDGATEFAKSLDEGSNVVILRGKLGDVNHESRTSGLTDALTEAGMNVLEVQDANCETDKAANVMEGFLSKYGNDGIDAVMVTSDSMAVGAAQAIKNQGISGIKICGFDGFQAAISLIETGEIEMIIGQKPYSMGYDGVNDGIGYLKGETFKDYYDPGIQMITTENYKEFIE